MCIFEGKSKLKLVVYLNGNLTKPSVYLTVSLNYVIYLTVNLKDVCVYLTVNLNKDVCVTDDQSKQGLVCIWR